MTASTTVPPMTGSQPIPESEAIPEAQEAPLGGGSTDGTDEAPEERRRRRKFLLFFLLLAALIFLLGLAIWYLLFRQPIPIPVVPGEVIMPGYVTSMYGANRPMGVAVTPSGDRIFIGETEGDRIARVFDAGGTQLGLMQPPVSTGAEHVPVYLAFDPLTSEVYVTDRPTGTIYVYDSAGTYQREYRPAAVSDGWQPLAIAFDAAGNLYVTDLSSDPQRVLVIDRGGTVVRTLAQDAGLSFPNGVAVDEAGNTYVTDGNNGRLLVFGTDGQQLAQVGRGVGSGNLGLPRGIAVSGGRVYVVDTTGQTVFVYGVLGAGEDSLDYLGSFGTEGVSDGAFEFPNGIAVDGRGRLYVTDSANDRVQVWSY